MMGSKVMRQFVSMAFVSGLILFVVAVLSAHAAGDKAKGEEAYKRLKCAKCHGDTGKGDGKTVKKLIEKGKDIKMNDWTDAGFMSKQEDKFLADITEKGGKAIGKSKRMPAYKKKLKDGDLENLVAFIRSFTN